MIQRLATYSAGHKLKMAGVLATMLASTLVQTLNPWPLKLVVDHVVEEERLFGHVLDGSQGTLLLITACGAYVLLAALRGSLGFFRNHWMTEVSQNASLLMRCDLYAQVQRLSLRFHDRARVGDMVTRITSDVDRLQGAFMSAVGSLTVDALSVFGIAVVMFLVDWQFALISLAVLPPYVVIFAAFRRRVREASRAVRSGEGVIASVAQEVLSSIRVVKAFGQEDREHVRFAGQTRSQVEASVRAATLEGMFSFWTDLATAAGIGTVLGYGGWRAVHGDLTLGQMLVFLQYQTTLYSPLQSLTRLTSVVQKASASAERLDEIFRAAPEVPESPTAVCLQRAHGLVAFEGVWFGYGPGRPVLRGVDLAVDAGEVVAVMGPTGTGKSTLLSLVPRFYDPTRGRVLVDGKDLRDLQVRSLRSQVSIVLQDTVLFSGTIRDNIAYGRPEASDREVMEAAQAAYAHEFIVGLPEGYDTQVGERGATLSGGQRQRIAIARALLKEAPILILDEPTSALDSEAEASIMQALARLMRGRTVILSTHRPSLIALADRVVALRDGVIVATSVAESVSSRAPVPASATHPLA